MISHSKNGRKQEGLGIAEERMEIYRSLAAEEHPDDYHADFAEALGDFSYHFYGLDRIEDALCTMEKAVALRRQLVADRSGLVNSPRVLSFYLHELNRAEEALQARREAVRL
jgi:hypothetical protein